jgi:hypothetical protein
MAQTHQKKPRRTFTTRRHDGGWMKIQLVLDDDREDLELCYKTFFKALNEKPEGMVSRYRRQNFLFEGSCPRLSGGCHPFLTGHA